MTPRYIPFSQIKYIYVPEKFNAKPTPPPEYVLVSVFRRLKSTYTHTHTCPKY